MTSTAWKIYVSGYGTFDFDGTEEDADAARRNKSRWEGGVGIKWRADLCTELDRATAAIATHWSHGGGIPVSLHEQWMKLKKKSQSKSCVCPREDALDCANVRHPRRNGQYDRDMDPCECCCHETENEE